MSEQTGTIQEAPSVLSDAAHPFEAGQGRGQPEFFGDLNLDQVVGRIVAGLDEYDLLPYFHAPLAEIGAIEYRQAVFRDLEDEAVASCLREFADGMRAVRQWLHGVDTLHDDLEREFWLLLAHTEYQATAEDLSAGLSAAELASKGLRDIREWVGQYIRSERFRSMTARLAAVQEGLDAVRYTVHVEGLKVTVAPYSGEPDYSAEVTETFAKFHQGKVRSHLVRYRDVLGMNHVEAQILRLVAGLNPGPFGALHAYLGEFADFLDPALSRLDREAQFYLSVDAYLGRLRKAGLPVCYPAVTRSKHVHAEAAYDLALAHKQLDDRGRVVTNDFALSGAERVIVVTGANQGGKTTFSRTFGQMHYLASLGCPVPGRDAELFLPDRIYTHYERQEDIHGLRSKLEDDLVRVHGILGRATSESILILNEIFTSTTLEDAIQLGTAVLDRVIGRGMLCVCVTFVDELTQLGDTVVSMVAGVDPADPAVRTLKIERRPADGLAHAVAIADKYGLTFDKLTAGISGRIP